MLNSINPYKLDWNPITVEAYNESRNEITMIFNFDITSNEKIKNVVQYVVGRTIWSFKNFPLSTNAILKFDIRGQDIIASRSNLLKMEILEFINGMDLEGRVFIEFYR